MIDSAEKLRDLVRRARRAGCVALDTEFVWERTYYPRLGLVQVALSSEECHLIDALAIEDLRPLGKLIGDTKVEKVFHDAEQDLTILRRIGGANPCRIFDTQHSAGFCGVSRSISLQDALRVFELADLEKTETRTDWTKRPLSDQQIAYAKDDVRYLIALRDALLSHARVRGRDGWMREELERYDAPELYEDRDPDKHFRRVKGVQSLSARGLAVLREGVRWREDEARNRDRTRSHIVSDQLLVALARHRPRNAIALKNLEGPFQRAIRKYSNSLLAIVDRGSAIPLKECPKPARRPSKKAELKARADKALAFMRARCAEAGIDPILMASRAQVTSVIGGTHLEHLKGHPLLVGWRKDFLGEEFLELLH